MPIIRTGRFNGGFNHIIDSGKDEHKFMMMDFGVFKLAQGQEVFLLEKEQESVLLLAEGNVKYFWNSLEAASKRASCFDENPEVLHLPKDTKVTIRAVADSEVLYVKTPNERSFEPKFYSANDNRVEMFGEGMWGGTALRRVKTVIEYANAPYSNLVVGELINFPGKWSSYPPHAHIHPELYYYRFDKPQGFGCSFIGDDAFKVMHNDTAAVTGGLVHPQSAAPGYPMYYCWVIRHLEGNPWNSRDCAPEHQWLKDKNAKIWPEK